MMDLIQKPAALQRKAAEGQERRFSLLAEDDQLLSSIEDLLAASSPTTRSRYEGAGNPTDPAHDTTPATVDN
jgi:hypothetical protein